MRHALDLLVKRGVLMDSRFGRRYVNSRHRTVNGRVMPPEPRNSSPSADVADPAGGRRGRRPWVGACRPAVGALLGLLACLAAAPRARACECPAAGDRPGRGASAIFEGRVVTLGRTDDGQHALLLHVTRSFRGPQRETLRVRAGSLQVCGGALRAGETYLVYAAGPADDLRTDRCLGTLLLWGLLWRRRARSAR